MITIQSTDHFIETCKHLGLIVVHFYADWAEQCKVLKNVFEELEKDSGLNHVLFLEIEAETHPTIAAQYKVLAAPTIIYLMGGKQVDRVDGVYTREIVEKVRLHAALADDLGNLQPSQMTTKPVAPRNPETKEELNARLRRLITAAPVMLFMKGDPNTPKCGFSRQIVNILNEHNADYRTFDILEDEAVRQGLKEFSDWPTYPQLYVNGDLVGGLDIVKEMVDSGELQSLLPKKQSLEDRLKRLINEADIMVFMKGSKDSPKCGFSRQTMDILKETGLPFSTFDILADEEVRQGLKTFSDWPTYPQVYVKGSLIGGLDIIKELKELGELTSSLKGES
ncbi:glutaredoxin-3-like isoform X2 [Artemia franciscana]|uniref:Glutaredoxin-3 n=2 Tax=Artemia franciscana TaxID=6661 RepID=A0AA88L649_ARTSF|nr:hypothetical protein QYM36_013155 [Artemia franciscana]KAK2709393.1 hypothetical protein QYM36_013155 [Artemia franciscana]KAK2709394.1 hypothetical protein QYM36_013155 [Artemia franciscana]KAK2709395.1 hypothetical protein QYM36_013155 [Artemia franciscana]KAK2709396.1 hypothetical protein QYM36_013155 [Artemia franciscana]